MMFSLNFFISYSVCLFFPRYSLMLFLNISIICARKNLFQFLSSINLPSELYAFTLANTCCSFCANPGV